MTGVITWAFDCGDGVCIEREQPSTALEPMPAYGIDSFTTKPNLNNHEADDFMKLGDIKGEFASKHDPLTGLDTGSANDRPTGNDHIVHHIGSTAGPGGSSFFQEDFHGTIGYEMEAGTDLRSDNRFVFEPMDVMPSLGESIDPGLDAAGGFQPHEVTAVQIGQPPCPELWLHTLG